MKNTLLFTYRTNTLVRLLTLNMKNFYTPKIRKCATPFQRHIPIRKCPLPHPLGYDRLSSEDKRALSFLGIVYGVNNALIRLAVWHWKRRITRFCHKKIYFNYRPVRVFQSLTLKCRIHCVSSLFPKCPYSDLYGNSSRGLMYFPHASLEKELLCFCRCTCSLKWVRDIETQHFVERKC